MNEPSSKVTSIYLSEEDLNRTIDIGLLELPGERGSLNENRNKYNFRDAISALEMYASINFRSVHPSRDVISESNPVVVNKQHTYWLISEATIIHFDGQYVLEGTAATREIPTELMIHLMSANTCVDKLEKKLISIALDGAMGK